MQTAPASPCTKICALDEEGYCLGCYRTQAEIVAWSTLSIERQWSIVGELPARAALRSEST